MTRINLLPWREAKREEQKRKFIFFTVTSAVAGLVIMGASHIVMNYQIDNQIASNTFLQSEIKKIDQQIVEIQGLKKQRTALIGRMNIIQNLQLNRTQVVHVFEELVNVLPKGVYLQSVSSNGDMITVEGDAESNTNVSQLMRNVSASHWVQDPVLKDIKTDEQGEKQVSQFSLHFAQVGPAVTNGVTATTDAGEKHGS
jgi:type IV pilus assembly protein PilN